MTGTDPTTIAHGIMPNRRESSPIHLLNLGCGSRFHADWVNIDFVAQDPCVLGHDLRSGIPFGNEQFDVVYHSHVLEHFSKEEGKRFLDECHRVLKPGGVIRVAVPDLEQIARLYLKALELADSGDDIWRHNYDWMMIELYDQAVRETPGGRHGTYLGQEVVINLDFILRRHGAEAERSIEAQRRARQQELARNNECSSVLPTASTPAPWLRKTLIFRALRRLYRLLRRAQGSPDPSVERERAIQHLLGDEYALLQLGRFRRSGEIHQWMYDRYSLARVLQEVGFQDAHRVGAAESRITGWRGFHLDTEPDGRVYKPDSLYIEAIKPF